MPGARTGDEAPSAGEPASALAACRAGSADGAEPRTVAGRLAESVLRSALGRPDLAVRAVARFRWRALEEVKRRGGRRELLADSCGRAHEPPKRRPRWAIRPAGDLRRARSTEKDALAVQVMDATLRRLEARP